LQCHGLCPLSCSTGAQHGCRSNLFEALATTCGDLFWAHELLQAGHRCVNNVDGVRRAERLAENVLDASALQHRAGCATGDNTGTWSSRTQHDDACSGLALHRVGDGAVDHRDAEEVLASFLGTLLDSSRDFLGLAVADTDHALAVTHDHQSGKLKRRPPLTTLDTRLMVTTRSMYWLRSSCWLRRSLRPPRSLRSLRLLSAERPPLRSRSDITRSFRWSS